MSFYGYIYTIGAAQGLVLAIALLFKAVNSESNRILAVWMLFLVFDLSVRTLQLNEALWPPLSLYVIVGFVPFVHGSFYYLYVRVITSQGHLNWSDILHFSGFLLMIIINLPWIIDPVNNKPNTYGYYELILYVYSVTYVVMGLIALRRYRKSLDQQHSNTEGFDLLWLDVMAYFQALIWLIAVSQWLIPIKAYNFWIIYIAVSLWMMVMGYMALLQQGIKPGSQVNKQESQPELFDDERCDEVDKKLRQLMREQKIYLDPMLTIGQLAKKSGYPEYLVSQVINRVYGKSFRAYVNALRIEFSKALLLDKTNNSTVLEIAYDSGFTSKSTFNSAFKRITEQTPSVFRKNLITD